MKTIARATLAVLCASLLTLSFTGAAQARNLSYSVGGGVKCYYVLVSSINGANTYQTVCYKSGV